MKYGLIMILNLIQQQIFNYDFEFNPTTNIQKSDNCPNRFDIYFRDEYRQAVWDKYDFYVLSTIWGPTYCNYMGSNLL